MARVRLLPGVYTHVLPSIGGCGEQRPAVVATVALLGVKALRVQLQLGQRDEPLLARAALVRPLARVHAPHVYPQRGRSRVISPAHATGNRRPRVRVGQFVSAEIAGLIERLLTLVAREWPLTRMRVTVYQ